MDDCGLSVHHSNGLVSVCVANYNGADVIVQCLDSIYAQQTTSPVEVLVHDDGSSDASLQLIQDQFPQVELIVSEENVGFCIANNRMVSRARGEYILLLNNDAWLADNAIDTFVQGASRENVDDCIYTLPQYDAESRELLDCGMFMDIFANPVAATARVGQPVAMVMGACLWVSKDLWRQCGGFPEWFGSMAEDMYLCHYARILGHEVVALPGSEYYHRVGHSFGGGKVVATGLATTFKRRRLSERNKLYVMFLFYPLLAVLLVLPIHLLGLLLEGLVLALIKLDFSVFSRIYGHALWSFFLNFPNLVRRRRVVQSKRVISMRKYFSVYRWIPHKLRMFIKHGIPKLN
jgi:GT2 family glycosyltransferase